MNMTSLVRSANLARRIDEQDRRIARLEIIIQGLATREQLDEVNANVAELKGMIAILLERKPGNSA